MSLLQLRKGRKGKPGSNKTRITLSWVNLCGSHVWQQRLRALHEPTGCDRSCVGHIQMCLCAEKMNINCPCLAVQHLLTAPAQLLPLPDDAKHITRMWTLGCYSGLKISKFRPNFASSTAARMIFSICLLPPRQRLESSQHTVNTQLTKQHHD